MLYYLGPCTISESVSKNFILQTRRRWAAARAATGIGEEAKSVPVFDWKKKLELRYEKDRASRGWAGPYFP